MRDQEKLDFRSVRPRNAVRTRKGGPAVACYRWCPVCRTRVTMPCVACAARKFIESKRMAAIQSDHEGTHCAEQ